MKQSRPKTITEIAKHFGVNERTVRRWVDAGCPVMNPSIQVFRFDLNEVVQWCKTHRAATKVAV